jgi:hypothetical protein
MAYQMMKGKKGNNDDDFPSIPGMIARYSASGLTNEQMAANPVWVDKTGNGHDLQMKNFAWGGMSGVGGYNQNFNQYFVGVDESNKTVSDSSMKLVLLESDSQKVIYDRNSYQIGHTYNFYIKVTGIEGRILNVNAGTLGGRIMSITEDGIYSINVTVSDSWGQNRLYLIFPPSSSSNTVTIEQLPLYPGALVFDGVDDYGVCENFPILTTKEKGYTVVALRKWLTPETKTINEVLLGNFKNNPIWTSANLGAFQFEVKYNVSKKVQTDSFGIGNNITLNNNHLFSYQISNSYNGSILRFGSNVGGNFFTVGCGGDQFYSNAAIWELVFLDHDATEEELTKIKDYFVKTYPWLFPDQAWTVTGKTNEDEDRATIANITGNGNNLVLSNFGFAEGSGYNEEGEYAGYLVTDGVDDKVRSSSFLFGNDFTVVGEWEFLQEDSNVFAGFNKNYTYFVLYNYISGVNVYVKNGKGTSIRNTKTLKAVTSEGLIYTDFNSEQKVELADKVEADFPLHIAYNGNNYTKMAFKNLAIYPTILSKDDCIKAYNYLQTLKAK